MFLETHYLWREIDLLWHKRFLKENKLTMYCARCDAVLMDRTGRKRTKETIWQYGKSDHILGHVHESCAYAIEVPGIEANTSDPNYGRPPHFWT